jgi:signal transduction histidine kinase
MIATLMLGLLSADVVARFERETDEERQTAVAETIQAERRQRAHWLHDDVCAELRLVSLKVQTEDTDRDEVVRLLDQFDHRLRLRQLDELFAAGPTRIAELLQPFIRHAQNMGIDVDEVPSFEDASSSLAPSDARLFARLVSVTTSNSINAGATRLAYAVHLSGREVSVTIRDNGPGFEVSQLPFGRALWSLRRDLSPGVLEIRSAPGEGTEIVATLIPVELPRRLDRRG